MSAARRRAWAASALQEPSNWSGEAFDDEDDDEVEVEEAVAGALGGIRQLAVSRRISAMKRGDRFGAGERRSGRRKYCWRGRRRRRKARR